MAYLVYQAHTDEGVINEALFSILSFYKAASPQTRDSTGIVVYTDSLSRFRDTLGDRPCISYEPLDTDRVRAWKGEIDFIHRVKIEVLRNFCQRYPGDALYLDADTCFLRDPAGLFANIAAGRLFMHTFEYVIAKRGSRQGRKWRQLLNNHSFLLPGGETVNNPLSVEMWNSCALSLAQVYAPMLETVLDLTDIMYKRYPTSTIEQLAFSYCFQTREKINALDETIIHYWNFEEFRAVLKNFFSANRGRGLDDLVARIDLIDPVRLRQPKTDHEKLPSWYRHSRRWLTGKTWELPPHGFGG
jgi:hypothetical protein